MDAPDGPGITRGTGLLQYLWVASGSPTPTPLSTLPLGTGLTPAAVRTRKAELHSGTRSQGLHLGCATRQLCALGKATSPP